MNRYVKDGYECGFNKSHKKTGCLAYTLDFSLSNRTITAGLFLSYRKFN